MTMAASLPPPDRHWLIPYVGLQQASDKRVVAALQGALDKADRAMDGLEGKPGAGATVRRAQILTLRGRLLVILAELFKTLGNTVREQQSEAAALAANLMYKDESAIWGIIESDPKKREILRKNMEDSARRNIQTMLRRYVTEDIPLSKRIYKTEALSKGQVTKMINRHIALGSSADDIVKDVRTFIRPDAPGGVSYNAKRLARTEIIGAFHAQSVADMTDRPWINQGQWNLSKSHSEQGCVCERYAAQRLFPIDGIPKRPHPGCMCTVTPKVPDRQTALKEFMTGQYAPYLP